MATDLVSVNPGELSTEVLPAMHVEWKVQDTLLLPQETKHSIDSPSFQFEDATWCLRVTVKEAKYTARGKSCGYIYINRIGKECFIPDRHVICHYGVKNANGESYNSGVSETVLGTSRFFNFVGFYELPIMHDLTHEKNDLVSKGLITVFCTFWVRSPRCVNADSKRELSECQLPNANPAELSTQLVAVTYVEWRIQAALLRPQEINHMIDSPSFQFRDGTCCLRAIVTAEDRFGDMSMYLSPLRKDSVAPEQHINGLVAIMEAGGEIYKFNSYEWNFSKSHDVEAMKYLFMGNIDEFNTFIVSRGAVTFSSYLWVDNAERPNADFKMDLSQGTDKLLKDLKNLFMSSEDSDVVIAVKGTEFRAHKCILRARSSVFNSMFSHDMLENNNSAVDIPDCDPDAFKVFLLYLYTGSIENLSTDIVFNLYRVADKYDAGQVRDECTKFMVSSLSVDTVCDVVEHALQYDDAELLKTATNFFTENFKEVILTVKWQNFLKNNAITANELIIKASKFYVFHK